MKKNKQALTDEQIPDSLLFSEDSEQEMSDEEVKSLLDNWLMPFSTRALDRRVLQSYRAQRARLPLWRRMLAVSISVPIPIAATMIVILGLGMIMLSRKSKPTQTSAPSTFVERIRTVEVPVIKERVLTRIVYRDRTFPGANQSSPIAAENISLTVDSTENAKSYFTGISLVGYQPNESMDLKVLKRTEKNEK